LQRVLPAVAAKYAHDLYASLRALDAAGADVILVEQPPQTPGWAAVNDRLRRAAGGAVKSDET
jgi:L-threonylcarbamoyladenylate synthase